MEINKNNYEAFFLDYHEGNLTAKEVAALLLFVEQHPELKEEFESFENIILDDLSSVEFRNKHLLKKQISATNKENYFIGFIENTLNEAEKNMLSDFLRNQPKALAELELYRKTITVADSSVAFDNKQALKRVATTGLTEQEHLLIAATENALSAEEKNSMRELLAGNSHIQKQLEVYQQTRLVPDVAVTFDKKESLKRKSEKVIPLFYYVGVAASVALLVGIFFLLKTRTPDSVGIAKIKTLPEKITKVTPQEPPVMAVVKSVKKNHTVEASTVKKDNQRTAAVALPATASEIIAKTSQQDSTLRNGPVKNELPILKQAVPVEELAVEKISQPNAITSLPEPVVETPQYISLRELAVEKIKEKLLDENTIAVQKKNGQAKKINGWDIAQIVTTGISKLSGRQIELKPNYSENGNVTSYAFSAGEFKISKKL